MVQVIAANSVGPQGPSAAPGRVSLAQDGGLPLPHMALAHDKQRPLPTVPGFI